MTIPTNAVMLTGGLGYSYNNTSTLPLTQTNLDEVPCHGTHGEPASELRHIHARTRAGWAA